MCIKIIIQIFCIDISLTFDFVNNFFGLNSHEAI